MKIVELLREFLVVSRSLSRKWVGGIHGGIHSAMEFNKNLMIPNISLCCSVQTCYLLNVIRICTNFRSCFVHFPHHLFTTCRPYDFWGWFRLCYDSIFFFAFNLKLGWWFLLVMRLLNTDWLRDGGALVFVLLLDLWSAIDDIISTKYNINFWFYFHRLVLTLVRQLGSTNLTFMIQPRRVYYDKWESGEK